MRVSAPGSWSPTWAVKKIYLDVRGMTGISKACHLANCILQEKIQRIYVPSCVPVKKGRRKLLQSNNLLDKRVGVGEREGALYPSIHTPTTLLWLICHELWENYWIWTSNRCYFYTSPQNSINCFRRALS